MLSMLLNRLAFRFKVDLSAEVGTQARKRPDLALAEHKHRGHLLSAELAECAAREPSAAIETIGKDLPPEVLAECAAREPSAAIETIGKDLPPEVLRFCRDRTS